MSSAPSATSWPFHIEPARPGAPLEVDLRGAEAIEQAIQQVGRRFAVAGFAGAAAAAAAAVWLTRQR